MENIGRKDLFRLLDRIDSAESGDVDRIGSILRDLISLLIDGIEDEEIAS